MMRRLHFALFFLMLGMGDSCLHAAPPASVTGMVRNSGGVPQIGAQVELLRPDLTVVATGYTNGKGHFSFAAVQPGHYAVKAMGAYFLPSLRENVHVRTNTIVNLTLNTLYEVMQWLPAEPRSADSQKDDWAWTLRSAANRPLLRWLEDGPLVVVSEGPHSAPKLKARLVATGRQGTFGEDGQRITAEVEETPENSRELLAHVDFDPSSDAGMESMLGFRQDLGFAGAVESVAQIDLHPEMDAGGAQGLNEISLHSAETINLGDEFSVEAGADQVFARFAQGSRNTVLAALPMLSIGWHTGDSTLRYRLATALPNVTGSEAHPGGYLPALAVRGGHLTLEHGTHQEIGWERVTDASAVSVLIYNDTLRNPVLEGAHPAFSSSDGVIDALYDPNSDLLHVAGQDFSSTGVVAAVQHKLPHGNTVRLSYANGDALVLPAAARPLPLSQIVAAARPRHAQMYSISLSGTLDGTGTRWRASYRWQPEDTVTRVAPYALDAAEPFFNLHLRQPLCRKGQGRRGIDAMLDMQNLLAQGYRPFVLTDGSLLMFAQDRRGLSAGVAFTF